MKLEQKLPALEQEENVGPLFQQLEIGFLAAITAKALDQFGNDITGWHL